MRNLDFTMILDRVGGLDVLNVSDAVADIVSVNGIVAKTVNVTRLTPGTVAVEFNADVPGTITIPGLLEALDTTLCLDLAYTSPIMGQVLVSRNTEQTIQGYLKPWRTQRGFVRQYNPPTVYETLVDIHCDNDPDNFVSRYGCDRMFVQFFKKDWLKLYGFAGKQLAKCMCITPETINNMQSSNEDWARRKIA